MVNKQDRKLTNFDVEKVLDRIEANRYLGCIAEAIPPGHQKEATMALYTILSNRHEGALATTDSLDAAGMIVHGLMATRVDPEWQDFWVQDEAGNEYYYDEGYRTVFSAACFAD